MSVRNEKLAQDQDLNIAIDPDILAVIRSSTAVSTQKGNSAALLKVGSKRRRTKVEMEEFRHMEETQRLTQQAQIERITELEQQLSEARHQAEEAKHAEAAVSQMLEVGFIEQ